MMPDAELSVVGERVAEEAPVVGGSWEGNRTPHARPIPEGEGCAMCSIDNCFYLTAKAACGRVEIDATEVIMD